MATLRAVCDGRPVFQMRRLPTSIVLFAVRRQPRTRCLRRYFFSLPLSVRIPCRNVRIRDNRVLAMFLRNAVLCVRKLEHHGPELLVRACTSAAAAHVLTNALRRNVRYSNGLQKYRRRDGHPRVTVDVFSAVRRSSGRIHIYL